MPKANMTFLTWDQSVALAEAHQERYRALVYVAVDSGMRWSELVGLRVERVDLTRRKVRVTEQLIRLQDCTWLRKEPKTPASIRSITVSRVTAGLLAEHIERFVWKGRDKLGLREHRGQPVGRLQLLPAPLLESAPGDRRLVPVHDLRHTSVALAIAEGAHPKAIQTRMGHSSINVTLDRYGHPVPGARRGDRHLVRREAAGGGGAVRQRRRPRNFGST